MSRQISGLHGQKRRGRPPGSKNNPRPQVTGDIRRPLWMKKLEALDSVSRFSSRTIKKPARFTEDSNSDMELEMPRGIIIYLNFKKNDVELFYKILRHPQPNF